MRNRLTISHYRTRHFNNWLKPRASGPVRRCKVAPHTTT